MKKLSDQVEGVLNIGITVARAISLRHYSVGAPLRGSQDTRFEHYLEEQHPDLYFQLKREVEPAMNLAEEGLKELERMEEERLKKYSTHIKAMATIQNGMLWLAMELRGGWRWFISILLYRLQPVRLVEEAIRRYLLHRSKRYVLWVVSAGLGILNFMAFCEMFGIDLRRPSLTVLILATVGGIFSASAMIAVHIALTSLIRATRDYDVEVGNSVYSNLFPHGWKDVAVWVTVLIVVTDALFSSVGLMLALPPNVRAELFWQLAVIAVSGFASIINVLLSWGMALEHVLFELRFKTEGAHQKQEIRALQEEMETAEQAKADYQELDRRLIQQSLRYRRLRGEAKRSYSRWHYEVRHRLWEEKLIHQEAQHLALMGKENGHLTRLPVDKHH